jgi:hypothetical protein
MEPSVALHELARQASKRPPTEVVTWSRLALILNQVANAAEEVERIEATR